jgi:predicted adenine nucleotide alpha hydrolase (AANH) superfamily ATPase
VQEKTENKNQNTNHNYQTQNWLDHPAASPHPSTGGELAPRIIKDFIVLFYNPNIFPESEYQKRLAEQIKLCESLGVKYHIGEYNHDEWLQCVSGLENKPERGRRCTQCFKMRLAFGAQWARENGYNAITSVFGVSKHKDQAQVDSAALSALAERCSPPVEGCPQRGRGGSGNIQINSVIQDITKITRTTPSFLLAIKAPQKCHPSTGGEHRPTALPRKTGWEHIPVIYYPIKWDESLRQQINRESDFYRQKYCGCEFSISS